RLIRMASRRQSIRMGNGWCEIGWRTTNCSICWKRRSESRIPLNLERRSRHRHAQPPGGAECDVPALSAELPEAMNALDADDGPGCIVITGARSGPVFPR